MLSHSTTSDCDPVKIAVNATTEICALPAYPVPDWCEQCATAYAHAIEGFDFAVSIAKYDPMGMITSTELNGATDPSLAAMQGISIAQNGSSLGAGMGWVVPPPVANKGARTFRVSTTPHFPAWASSRRGGIWKRLGATDLLVGIHPIGASSSRAVIIEIGMNDQATHIAPVLARMLDATMPILVERLVMALGNEAVNQSSLLTAREQEVLEQIVTGRTVREIAGDLDRSPHTVHDHVKSLHRKFNASTRGELVARALGHVTKPTNDTRSAASLQTAAC